MESNRYVIQPQSLILIPERSRRLANKSRLRPDDFVIRSGLPRSGSLCAAFSSLLKKKQDRDVMDGLKIIAPDLQRIEVVSESIGPSIYLDIGLDTLVPLTVCGEGMVRMFSIILELISSRNGVLLIDEIDNGLHYTVMSKLWKLLGALVEKHDVQIFATTHNDDMMRLA